ncbi:MAG TPA: signal peptide peptidase SppA [Spirochaetota bacterium]|nr:signal peptide peptidase SppA [Spirochaetota bacterium]
MEKQRKITLAILIMLVLISIIAVVDISTRVEKKRSIQTGMGMMAAGPGIAIVRIDGPIELTGPGGFMGKPSGAEAVVKRLADIEKDGNIKAVVLRINSPGGTVAATQEIYQKILSLRKKNIIVVASMGDIAASGGYYIASACSYIVANYGTITGSIGVIAYSPNLKNLMDKFGIKMNVIKSGKYKDILATHRDMSSEERALIQQMIDLSYHKFVKDIALGRNMNQNDIYPVADGRVMSAETALEHKLIDQLGTFDEAINKAKELAGLDADAPVYEEHLSPFNEIFSSMNSFFSGRLFESRFADTTHRIEYRYMQ